MVAKEEKAVVASSALEHDSWNSTKGKNKLTEEEQRYYIMQAQAGDLIAKEILVNKNAPLVYALVQRFLGRGLEKEDLYQIGTIGLLKAIQNFDLSYQNCFSTYAVPLIIGEIKRAIRDDQPVHVSRSYKELAYKIYQAKEKYLQEYGQEPSIQMLSHLLHIPANEIVMALEANQKTASLQTPVEAGKQQTKGVSGVLQDFIAAPKETEDRWVEELQLRQFFKKLPPRLQYIMMARYFKEETQGEIAKTLGVSQVQVSRLEKQALQILKNLWQEE